MSGFLSEQLGVALPARWRQTTPAPDPEPVDSGATPGGTPNALAALYDAASAIAANQEYQSTQLDKLCTAVASLVTLLNQAARPDVRQSVALKASEAVIIDRAGYKHCYLLVLASTATTFDIPGVGSITRTLAADWNRLDYPTGTRITIAADPAAGTQTNALLLLTDTYLNV